MSIAKPEHGDNLYFRDGTYYARFVQAGKLVRRTLRTADEKQANIRLASLKNAEAVEVKRLAALAGGRMLWKEAVVRFLEVEGPANVKSGTLERYTVSLKAVSPWFRDLYLDEISYRRVSELVSARKRDGVTNATVNRDLTAISQILRFGRVWMVCTENAAKDFDRKLVTKEVRTARAIPTDDQIELLARQCHARFADVVRFARLEGARQEEIVSLEWVNVDLNGGSVQFMVAKRGIRAIRLGRPGLSLLRQIRAESPGAKFVFNSGRGERFQNVSSRFALASSRLIESEAREGRTFPDFTFHDLRHAYAVAELRLGRDIYDLSRHLGHTSVKTTEIYLGYVPGGRSVARVQPEQRTPTTDSGDTAGDTGWDE